MQVTLQYQDAASSPVAEPIATANPAILTSGSGTGQASAVNQDGTINGASHTAAKGEVILLYATGEGITNPPGADGAITGSSLPKPVLPVSVTIGGRKVTPLYAGEAPGEIAGVMQINEQIPFGIARYRSTYRSVHSRVNRESRSLYTEGQVPVCRGLLKAVTRQARFITVVTGPRKMTHFENECRTSLARVEMPTRPAGRRCNPHAWRAAAADKWQQARRQEVCRRQPPTKTDRADALGTTAIRGSD